MAHGRPDYWKGILPGQNIWAAGQSSWYAAESGDIGFGANADLIDYPVPADTILHITAVFVGCNFPGIQKYAINFPPVPLSEIYYDSQGVLPMNPLGTFEVTEGNSVVVTVYNIADMLHTFNVLLLGFEEVA